MTRGEGERRSGGERARVAELVELERTLVAIVFMSPEHAVGVLDLAPSCDFEDKKAGQLLEAIAIVHARGHAVTLESVVDAVDAAYPNGGKKGWLDLLCEITDDYAYPVDPVWLAKRISEEHAQGESKRERAPVLVRMADVEPETVEFLWVPYLPKRKLALLEGDPGLGKTYLALAIAAAVSRGFPLPGIDGVHGGRLPANVVYLTAEDGLGDTLRPRLDGTGADLNRIFVLDGRRDVEGRVVPVTLEDLDVLESAVSKVRPELVVVDPIQGFLGAGIDMYRANEVRPLLAGLARLAERFGFAALLIRHLRKSVADRSVHRGLGSIDFSAAARSIILVGEDPANDGRRILAHHKSNLAKAGPSLGFEILEGRFRWAGLSDLKADDLLASRGPGGTSPRQEAESFLQDALAAGPGFVTEIGKEAQALGIAHRTLLRAKSALGVEAKKVGFGRHGKWQWRLPASPKSAAVSNREGDALSRETHAESVSASPTDQVGTLSNWRLDPAVEVEINAWGRADWDRFEGYAARLEDEGFPRDEAEAMAYARVVEERRTR
jgi:hypothetical protein